MRLLFKGFNFVNENINSISVCEFTVIKVVNNIKTRSQLAGFFCL